VCPQASDMGGPIRTTCLHSWFFGSTVNGD
jgi:hypothetical protein